MRVTRGMLAACLAAALTGTATNAEGDRVHYQLQVFRLMPGFTSKTILENEIWAGRPKDWDEIKEEVTLFDHGEFHFGSDKLLIHRRGCFWNGNRLTFEEGLQMPLPEDRIKMVYSPMLLRKQGELVRMKIESRQPFEFMRRRPDGLFELEQTVLPVGMDIEIRAEDGGRKLLLISYLELELRTVNRRKPVPGTGLAVGQPVVEEHEYRLRLRVRENKNYGLLLQPKGSDGAIVVRLEIDER